MVSVSALDFVPRNDLKMQTSQHVQIVQCVTKKFHLQAESSKLPTRYSLLLHIEDPCGHFVISGIQESDI